MEERRRAEIEESMMFEPSRGEESREEERLLMQNMCL
jgi:hypothetical protein